MIVALYFERRRGTASGIANAGIGSGTFIAPPVVEILFRDFGFAGAFILLAAFGLQTCVFGALFRPLAAQYRISKRYFELHTALLNLFYLWRSTLMI